MTRVSIDDDSFQAIGELSVIAMRPFEFHGCSFFLGACFLSGSSGTILYCAVKRKYNGLGDVHEITTWDFRFKKTIALHCIGKGEGS